MNAKYVNAIPINRMAEEFKRNDVNISRQVMANWTIQCSEKYLSILYDELHKELFNSKVLQADETPVLVRKDGRPAGSKSYLWVYRTAKMYNADPIVIYEYQKTRKIDHPREFLKGYAGTVVTDGYQVYHSIADEREDLIIAGCWSHARRKFADFFAWINENKGSVPAKSATGKAFTCCLNQEKYLKVFLENGEVPMDNNAAEQAIRAFCVGKRLHIFMAEDVNLYNEVLDNYTFDVSIVDLAFNDVVLDKSRLNKNGTYKIGIYKISIK